MVHLSAIGADATSTSHYARSKAAGEQQVLAAHPAATIMRPSIVFGPEDSFFNRFAALARISPALPLAGGGHTRFQPVFAAAETTLSYLRISTLVGRDRRLRQVLQERGLQPHRERTAAARAAGGAR